MTYIEAPQQWNGTGKGVFLAGGISGCADWQDELKKLLACTDLTVINPRRKAFPMDDPSAAGEQIGWEFDHLRRVWGVAFWFPKETLCPIALYELGGQAAGTRPIFVGVDVEYQRRLDVEIQLRLARPNIRVVIQLSDLANEIRAAAKGATP